MHAFGLLAEAKMAQWEQDRKNGTAPRQSRPSGGANEYGDSLEKQLYGEIERLVLASAKAPAARREDMLRQSERLQVQLMCRLEKSGYNHLVKLFGDRISELKRQNS